MWTPHAEYLALGSNKRSRSESYRQLYRTELGQKLISEIRLAANVGLALGNDGFKEDVERLTGQRQHHLKRGPKPKPRSHPNKAFLL